MVLPGAAWIQQVVCTHLCASSAKSALNSSTGRKRFSKVTIHEATIY